MTTEFSEVVEIDNFIVCTRLPLHILQQTLRRRFRGREGALDLVHGGVIIGGDCLADCLARADRVNEVTRDKRRTGWLSDVQGPTPLMQQAVARAATIPL